MNNTLLPSLTIITPMYNAEKYIEATFNSVVKQTYSNYEWIIVDDKSTDRSLEIATRLANKDKRITILKNDKNYGPSYSRNRALDIAKGKYIALLDSDDICLPNRLEKQIEFLDNNPDVVACGSWFKYIGIKNHEVKRTIDDNEYYRCCLLFGNVPTLLNPSVMIRKDILDKYNIRYDERLRYGEDYKMWTELSRIGRITNIKEVLLHYRTHEKQVTHNNGINRQSSNNDNIVKQELLDELKLELTDIEKDIFFNYIHSKYYKPNNYIDILNRIVEVNKLSKIYQQDKLEKRMHEQWVNVIQNIKNPFVLFHVFLKQKGNRREILRIKNKQIKNIFIKENKNKKIYIDMNGRTGNQFFQYAFARKLLTIDDSYELVIDFKNVVDKGKELHYESSFIDTLNQFNVLPYTYVEETGFELKKHGSRKQRRMLKHYYFVRKINSELPKLGLLQRYQYKMQKNGIYKEDEYNIKLFKKYKGDIFIKGYFENPKYFDDIRDILLKEFTPKYPPNPRNKELYDIINNNESVCVSIRIWDEIQNNKELLKSRDICSKEFYYDAMDKIHDKYPNAVFIIFSNNIPFIKDNYKFKYSVYYESGEDKVYEKLRLMSLCKHFIFSPSTFSWWGQYLSQDKKDINFSILGKQ